METSTSQSNPTLYQDEDPSALKAFSLNSISSNSSPSKWACWMRSYYKGISMDCNPWPYNNPDGNQKKKSYNISPPLAWTHVANCCQKTTAAGILPPHVNGKQATDKDNTKKLNSGSAHTQRLDKYVKWPSLPRANKRKTAGLPYVCHHQIPRKTPYGSVRLIAWLHMWKTDKAITTVFMFEE